MEIIAAKRREKQKTTSKKASELKKVLVNLLEDRSFPPKLESNKGKRGRKKALNQALGQFSA
jgi:hypothetical protein